MAKRKMKPLGQRLQELRESARLSRSELGKKLGWSELRVYRIETGITRALAEDVEAIARALNKRIAELYGEAA